MDAREATLAVCAAWERGDPYGVADLFTEDGRYEDPLWEEAVIGPDAIREQIGSGMAAIRNLTIPIKHVVLQDDVAICEASFLSELADGSGRFDFDFAMVIEVRDGRISRLAEFFDTRPLVP